MDKKVESDWNKFFDSKEIKRNLIDSSLFLAFYEILKNTIVDRIADFFNNEFKNGKFVNSTKYNEQIIWRKIKGKQNIFSSSCLWLVENNVITFDDHNQINEIRLERDRIAHNLPKFLLESEYIIRKDLFNLMKDLTLKIDKWWIVEVDLTINQELIGQNIDTDKIVSGNDLILSYIFNIANTDLNDLEKQIKDD